ncbi:tRNA (N6-isopentenyl adenosine(37)-C2)-methylthiotransferase MiaB [Geobacter pickeringii]|uniref:tRNA-2-methylthio-N(6)-dimethylallyladenosine synthase n=1 Tax=Geobacter pickeringii TaxID=345632 RepID=A0A0B5BAD3_9BACT|nr:tRNA (N6-isopentenyl adenosine(37)-C2)-methylthiotransferase MiaB [Geobacter pickeringii]AJE03668.1 (dimethylallyl)adenosine tRNA methylthiotransferase [Geobacter pickeringii]
MTNEKLLYIETFGCQMNVSDSEKIASLLKGLGYSSTDDSSRADLIILNTCSVRAKAEEKVYGHLGSFKGLKRERKGLLLGVGGCVAQQEGERLLKKVPWLDLVFGTHNLHLLPEMVQAAERGERRAEVQFIDSDTRLDLFPAGETEGGVTRFVTVMQGCDNFCSYCIVPYVRGREISRRSADILAEIRGAVAAGVKEVTLLGQNVNSYGIKTEGEISFAELLRQVAAIDGLERIRFTTSHPKDISPELIACFAELPKLCGYIHLPAQAGSDAVLSRMNRGYTRQQYLGMVADLKGARPDIQITGDIIVGFPGETDEDFEQTLSLVEEVDYADLFTFIYSVRPGTKAAELPGAVSRKEKQQRFDRLQEMLRIMTRRRNESFVGTRQKVLVEGVSKRGDQLFGRTDGNRVVNFSADPSLVGKIAEVAITFGYQNSLLGELFHD